MFTECLNIFDGIFVLPVKHIITVALFFYLNLDKYVNKLSEMVLVVITNNVTITMFYFSMDDNIDNALVMIKTLNNLYGADEYLWIYK